MNPARSAGFVVLTQVARLALSVVSLATVSRLLAPVDFGLFAMIVAVLGVGELFRDFGLSMAAIQASVLSRAQQSNLFWLNLGIGAVLTMAAAGFAPFIAGLYGRPELALPIVVVGCNFIVSGAAAQYRVGLVRRDRFASLAIADTSSQALSLLIAITLAVSGAGLWALVAQVGAQAALALLLLVVQLRWLPGLPSRAGDLRPMIGFGANLLGTQVLTYLGKNIDNILLGKYWGPTALGFYSRAFTLYSMPQQQALAPFTDLAVRTLSASRANADLYRQRIVKMQMIANYVSLSLFGVLIALANPVVLVVLGSRWAETAVLLQILCVGGIFQLLGNVYYWLFLTEGLTRLHFRIALITQPVAVICIVLGLPFGARGVAWGATAGLFIEWLVPATLGAARTSQSARRLLLNTVRPAVVCLGGSTLMHLMAGFFASSGPLMSIAAAGLVALCWIALCFGVWPGVRGDVWSIVAVVKSAIRSKRQTGTSEASA